jgi:hypothetical protein
MKRTDFAILQYHVDGEEVEKDEVSAGTKHARRKISECAMG